MPVSSGEVGETANGRGTFSESASFAQDPQQHQPQPQPQQQSVTNLSLSQSYPASADNNQLNHHLQAGATSPGVAFSDEHYEQDDSDMEAELDSHPSRETLHEGQILKSGYLYKKGERIKIWKKKWFVLRTSKLAYYKDSKEYVLLRIIDIRDIHKAAEVVVKNRAGVFVILTPKRTFTVQAESVAEMEEWIEAINQAKVQYELASSSDMGSSSYSGSTPQMEFPSSAPSTSAAAAALAASKKPELVKQGSGTFLPPRKQNQSPLSLSDPGLLTSTGGSSDSGARIQTRNVSSTTSSYPQPRSADAHTVSGLSLGIMSQSLGHMPSTTSSSLSHGASGAGNTNNSRTPDGLSLVTAGTQAIRIASASNPSSPPRPHYDDLPSNSFSSIQSFNTSPGTPNSPEYGSGGERFGMGEQNSSEEEDVVDDPTVLEAGRVAAAANAPGSGLVTGEQLESKVVRQGFLLKLGKRSKTWRKKWFVLRGDKLTYYKNAKEYQPLGIIPLSNIIDSLQTDPVSKHKLYCLRIVTSKRSFVCCADDEDTLLQWIDALHVECGRVAREAKWEKDHQHDANAAAIAEDDARVLTDSKALGRTAHMGDHTATHTMNGAGVTSPRHGDGPMALRSNAHSAGSQLKKAVNMDTNGGNDPAPISLSSSSLGHLPSVTFQTPMPTLFEESTAPRQTTVTFSV
ncbi:hypothetical protein BGZ58_006631 [Dissophora ornata]|nr:hypothetical protein BGZ58_006631 [Dissophora ornata]